MNRIFKEAAKLIDNGKERFSCLAVSTAARESYPNASPIRDVYMSSISPEDHDIQPLDFEGNPNTNNQDAINHRVIALLLIGEAWGDL